MSEPFAAESPLAEFFGSTRPPVPDEPSGAVLTERPPHGQLNLRGDPARPAFLDGVRRALGFDLPLDPNTTADADDLAALWLGPDEWLILTPDDRTEEVAGRLRAEFRAEFAAITDVSAASAVIRLTGPRVRDVLAAGCPLDLHPRAFHVGRCAQTILAKATARSCRSTMHRPSIYLSAAASPTTLRGGWKTPVGSSIWLWHARAPDE